MTKRLSFRVSPSCAQDKLRDEESLVPSLFSFVFYAFFVVNPSLGISCFNDIRQHDRAAFELFSKESPQRFSYLFLKLCRIGTGFPVHGI
jgi:hypothetical protein